MRALVTVLAFALVTSLLAGGCTSKTQEGLLTYTAESLEGGDLDAKSLEYLSTDIQARISELGVRRNDVGAIPPRTLRIVLPENAVPRIPEIRKMLDEATDLRAKLTFVQQGG